MPDHTPGAAIRAAFFDIDGTLVPFGHTAPPPDTVSALAELRRRGIKVFVSSGRQITWINNTGPIEFDGYVTINGGACLLADRRTVVYSQAISRDDIGRLVGFGQSSPHPFVIVPLEGQIFVDRVDEVYSGIAARLHIPPVPVMPLDEALGLEVGQVMGFLTQGEEEACGLMTHILSGCVSTRWSPEFCDIIPRGVNKAEGIRRILACFGLDISEAIAFGDGGNDREMLREAGIGVAMGGSAPAVCADADFVTLPADCGGIASALRHFGLIP